MFPRRTRLLLLLLKLIRLEFAEIVGICVNESRSNRAMRMSSWLKKQLLANCVSRLNFLRLHVGEKHNSITLSLKRMEEYDSTCNWTIWTLCNFGFSGSRFHEILECSLLQSNPLEKA